MVKWIITEEHLYECPVCHSTFDNRTYRVSEFTTCPCCGTPTNEEENNDAYSKL